MDLKAKNLLEGERVVRAVQTSRGDLVYEQMKIPEHVPSFRQGFVRQPCMIFLISSSSAFIPSIFEYILSLNCSKSSSVHSAATPCLIETQTKSVK